MQQEVLTAAHTPPHSANRCNPGARRLSGTTLTSESRDFCKLVRELAVAVRDSFEDQCYGASTPTMVMRCTQRDRHVHLGYQQAGKSRVS